MNDDAPVEGKSVISDESDTEKKNRSSSSSVPVIDASKIVQSPAPAPVPGGDDDFFTVSAVRKIKVTAPPGVGPNSKPAPVSETNQNKMSANNDDDYSESSDGEFDSDSEPMEIIEKSPYEAHQDAEKGEPLFTRMKEILKEEKSAEFNRGKVSDEAKKIFGASDSWDMIKANSLIQKSGMVYSQEWTEGMIRGERIGAPKELILLCLNSNRLSKQGDQLLSGLTRDFGVSSIVAEGLKQFKLAKKYPRIMGVTKNYQFSKRRRDCYKAAIFVARAYGCYKAFGNEGPLSPNLKNKILECLDMMEANLKDDDSKKKRISNESAEKSLPDLASLTSSTLELQKRKRGRPPKNPRSEPAPLKDVILDDKSESEKEFDGTLDSPVATVKKKKRKSTAEASKKGAMAEESFDEGDDDDNMYAYNPPLRGNAGKKKKMKSAPAASDESPVKAVTSSLPNLINMFEQQYNEMGKVYRKMGETLQELKSKIQENRTATEEELRAEILLEVQESLLKSFGKS